MRALYDYNAMILQAPRPNYSYIPQGQGGYVHCWKHAFTPDSEHHFSIAPHSNNNGFHITSANRGLRVYYNRTGTKIRKPKRATDVGAISSLHYPIDWNHDAQLMAAYLDTYRL